MPKIPTYTRQYSIPGQSGNALQDVGSAGMVGEAIAGVGKAGIGLATNMNNLIIRQNEKLRLRDNESAAEDADNSIRADIRNWRESYLTEANQSTGDPDTLKKLTDQRTSGLKDYLTNTYLSPVTDPDRALKIGKIIDNHFNNALDIVAVYQAGQRGKYEANVAAQGLILAVQAARDDGRPPEDVYQEYEQKVLNLHVSGGAVDANKAEDLLIAGRQQITIGFLDGLKTRNPARFVELIESGKYSDKISEAAYRHFRDEAVSVKKDEERKAKSAAGDLAYNEIFNQFSLASSDGDYAGAIRHVNNPNNLPGLDRATRETLFNQIKGQQAYAIAEDNRKTKEAKNHELDAIWELQIKGNVTAAVKAANDSRYLGGEDKARVLHNLTIPQPEGKSDNAVYLAGLDKMYDESVPLDEKKTWLLTNRGRLNATDFKHLGGVGISQERAGERAKMRSDIATLKAVLYNSSQTAKERLDKAIKLREAGTPTSEILAMPEFSNINPIEDMKSDMRKLRGVGTAPESTGPSLWERVTGSTKTVTIDGKEYHDGDVITKDGKSFRVKVK